MEVYIYETYGSRSLPLSTTHDGTFVEACVCVLPLHTMGALPPLPISTSTRTFTEHTHLLKYIYIYYNDRQTDINTRGSLYETYVTGFPPFLPLTILRAFWNSVCV